MQSVRTRYQIPSCGQIDLYERAVEYNGSMRTLLRGLPFLAAFLFFTLPAVASAAPFGLPDSIIPKQCQDCAAAWRCVLATFDNLIAFALAFSFIVATLLITYAGFLWVLSPSSPSNIAQGKKILGGTVIGLVVTFGAWLIVNTLLGVLTNLTVGSATGVLTTQGADNWCIKTKAVDVGTLSTGASPLNTGNTQKEQAIRTQLATGGFQVNKEACPAGAAYNSVPGGCTSVGGLQPATVQHLILLRQKAGINSSIMLTGGSELGHKTHSGGKQVDIGFGNSQLNTFIRSFPRAGAWSDGTLLYKDACGNIYASESDHWHIDVVAACANPKP